MLIGITPELIAMGPALDENQCEVSYGAGTRWQATIDKDEIRAVEKCF